MEIYTTAYDIIFPKTWNQNLIKSLALTVWYKEYIYLRTPQEMESRIFRLLENLQKKTISFLQPKIKKKKKRTRDGGGLDLYLKRP